MRMVSVAIVIAASLVAPALSGAQSLGEVAAQSKEKQKGKKAKVYTEDDLKRASGRTASFPEGPAVAEPAPASAEKPEGGAQPAAPKVDEQKRAEQEKAWRERVKKTNDDVTRLTAQVTQLETALNVTGGAYSASRANMTSQLEEAKKQLATAQKTVGDLQQEGLKNGFK